MTREATESFADRLLTWFDVHGRHDLPWQSPRTAYRTWVAEVMLQQTQVRTVVPYFLRFVQRFPDVRSLAQASQDDVLEHWAGLGYYARGRNLYRAAQEIVGRHAGEMPRDFDLLHALPGIGASTAGAILAQAYGDSFAILDANVKRVLARHAAVADSPSTSAGAARLWALSRQRLPARRLADYTQAIMDLGANLCRPRAPLCTDCPVSSDCLALRSGTVNVLPLSKRKKARPVRHAVLLLVENPRGELLLERRPASGIWGGLWCPPLRMDDEVTSDAWRRYADRLSLGVALPDFRHVFTHFELVVAPRRIRDDQAPLQSDSVEDRWVTLREQLPGMPAPIARLLRALEPVFFASPSCPEPFTA